MNFCKTTILILLLSQSFHLVAEQMTEEHQQWLKDKFSTQHEQLIPIVAVADMFFACNKERQTFQDDISVKKLILKTDRNTLASHLSQCLKDDLPNSDVALNFGLIGCFHEQLQDLPEQERKIKKKLVLQAIKNLSKEERKKSFAQCVTDQAIGYLK